MTSLSAWAMILGMREVARWRQSDGWEVWIYCRSSACLQRRSSVWRRRLLRPYGGLAWCVVAWWRNKFPERTSDAIRTRRAGTFRFTMPIHLLFHNRPISHTLFKRHTYLRDCCFPAPRGGPPIEFTPNLVCIAAVERLGSWLPPHETAIYIVSLK